MISNDCRYPVDRYLIKSNKKVEMVSIIDDDIWNPEPALKPEDEIILRKLHEMLQATSDDLKQLSNELTKYHQPGVQIKAIPTPLDDEFNEKVHIEEVVNAKFFGHKIIDKTSTFNSSESGKDRNFNFHKTNLYNPKVINTGVQAEIISLPKKLNINKKLCMTRPKHMEIRQNKIKENKNNNNRINNYAPSVFYDEFNYKYQEPKIKTQHKLLNIQKMPSINIRSELKEQKVLQLDILPEPYDNKESTCQKNNIAVIAVHHEVTLPKKYTQKPNYIHEQSNYDVTVKYPVRKVSKMLTCESSGSSNDISINQRKLNVKNYNKKTSLANRNAVRKSQEHIHPQIEDWKKRLNIVYGQVSTAKKEKLNIKKRSKVTPEDNNLETQKALINSEYIPYSHLTLGGVRVSDIENEISDLPNKKNIPLSPILDKISSSQHHPIKNKKHRKNQNISPKILTTSDENLLQEVIDIENSVGETLVKNKQKLNEKPLSESGRSKKSDYQLDSNNSYDDDFEDEKSHLSFDQNADANKEESAVNLVPSSSEKNNSKNSSENEEVFDQIANESKNTTYTNKNNLSLKNAVDVHEYVHLIDTHDSATQINATHKISLKETQTSPTYDRSSIHPIHNDLWSSLDPQDKVENLFNLEKDLIKKFIYEEYGELFEKTLTKPSTSKDTSKKKNIAAFQKITQTSPARVKSVATSPPRMKTRTTSPFTASVTVAQQTSPIENSSNKMKEQLANEEDDLSISVNLSSPRFRLKLPQSSSEVLSNPEDHGRKSHKSERLPLHTKLNNDTIFKKTSSSSSTDAYNSTSDISSLGEIILKRKLRKLLYSESDSSDSSIVSIRNSELNSIIPLKSEGEISLGQNSRNNNKNSKSEGELSNGL